MLTIFVQWALFRKEVSTAFMTEISELPDKVHIASFNKTLNIQWALDIRAEFQD